MSDRPMGKCGSSKQHRRHMARLKRTESGAPDLGRRNCPPVKLGGAS